MTSRLAVMGARPARVGSTQRRWYRGGVWCLWMPCLYLVNSCGGRRQKSLYFVSYSDSVKLSDVHADFTVSIRLMKISLNMAVNLWVDSGTFPPTFWSGGDALCFVRPYFFCVGIFVLMHTHGIRSMIGAIFVTFSPLILMKFIKIVAIKCQILRLKCTKFSAPLAAFKCLFLRGGEEKLGGDWEVSPPLFFCTSVPMSLDASVRQL